MLESMGWIVDSANELLNREPFLALALGAAMVAVFVTALARRHSNCKDQAHSIGHIAWHGLMRLLWASFLVLVLVGALRGMQVGLQQVEDSFRHRYGRVTEVNLAAVRTIWGEEQAQGELTVALGYDVEDTQRLESEDPTRPAVIRTVKRRETIDTNPFVSAQHSVIIERSDRTKGSAIYPGYTTDCRFTYELRNPDSHDAEATLRFPLPSRSSPIDGLVVKLNGSDALDRVRLANNAITLDFPVKGGEAFTFAVAYRSRGMYSWYFQVREQRELRNFNLTLTLPDLPVEQWNNPEGCMTPTTLSATADGKGSLALYTLDHAIVGKGMGIGLPRPVQPGAAEARVLREAQKGWGWMFAAAVLALTLGGARMAPVVAVISAAAVAIGYSLLGSLYETPLGFWVAAAVVLIPIFAALAWATRQALPPGEGRGLGTLMFIFAGIAPFAAALDDNRKLLYWSICAVLFLALATNLVLGLHRTAVARTA